MGGPILLQLGLVLITYIALFVYGFILARRRTSLLKVRTIIRIIGFSLLASAFWLFLQSLLFGFLWQVPTQLASGLLFAVATCLVGFGVGSLFRRRQAE